METREFECLQGLMDGFRNHLRLTTTDMDGILMENLRAAILVCEHEISTVIPVSSFTLGTEFSPAISLRYPVLQVTSVKVDGQVVPATEYSFDQKELRFASGVEGSAVEVQYSAGLPQIPFDIQAAIFLLGAGLFNNPTDHPEERDRTSARNLLRPYRRWGKH